MIHGSTTPKATDYLHPSLLYLYLSNYAHWKYRMEVYLKNIDFDLWVVTANGPLPLPKELSAYIDIDNKNASFNCKALSNIFCALSAEEHARCIFHFRVEEVHEGTK